MLKLPETLPSAVDEAPMTLIWPACGFTCSNQPFVKLPATAPVAFKTELSKVTVN
ncbi:MAG: hypothetical protein BWX89_01226 [candidate division TA06 bacterium ADurb.Bin131]|uniref:Uncharacterized protein n=1 Tax=candidate division TA06 bacterium ADurb.Bin131 TaxID=1852827 RepID=A0A1V6C741_UNCT6|nr:MAG: hypothetical protein BWX89_01226 [candidate division TA06 bacterium ADurb.Bin131]